VCALKYQDGQRYLRELITDKRDDLSRPKRAELA
jgi:hypothetical protein